MCGERINTMNSVYALLTAVLLFASISTCFSARSVFEGMCPVPQCYCGMDNIGRLEVNCNNPDMTEIPTSRISPDIEVIRIVPSSGYNQLTIGRVFRQFRKIEEIHIVKSKIPNLGDKNFFGVSSLKVLNITRNKIDHITDTNFQGLSSLNTLSLSDNLIESFVSESFKHLTKLKVLDLSKNKITKLVERMFYNLHILEVLNLSNNNIRDLNADVFRDIWRLKEFRCRHCGIYKVNPLLYSLLPDLKILDLSDNQLSVISPQEFRNLRRIDELYLDRNKIRTLTEDSFSSTKIRHLSLRYNKMREIDGNAFLNGSINHLDLSSNELRSLNKLIFIDIKGNLTKLDLSNNPNLKVNNLMIILTENIRYLKHLNIAYNDYRDLPLDLFEDLHHLTHLNLSHNKLNTTFASQYANLYQLQVIDLSYNLFKGFENEVLNKFDRMNSIRELRLEGNPFSCDLCHIMHLLGFVKSSPLFNKACIQPGAPACLRCKAPRRLRQRTIISLEETELEWCTDEEASGFFGEDSRLGIFLIIGLLFLIVILITGGILVRLNWHTAHYYTNEEKLEFSDSKYYATINGTHKKMVSTIDQEFEVNFYPDVDR